MRLTSTIISCEARADELAKTRQQLKSVGIEAHELVMECNPPSIEGNLYGAFLAASVASEAGTGLLFLEDDIDVAPSLPAFLRQAIEADVVTTFILFRESLYPTGFEAAARRDMPVHASLVRLQDSLVEQRRGFHGSQAIYMPPRAVKAILTDRDEFVSLDGSRLKPRFPPAWRDGFDFWVKRNARTLGGLYAAYPNPVQHRNSAPSTFSGKVGKFVSNSFGLPVSFKEEQK